MSTISSSGIVSSNATHNLTKASTAMYAEIFGSGKFSPLDAFFNTLKTCGVLNYEEKLQNSAGDTVNMYNTPRLDMLPNRGDVDRYSNAKEMKYGDRDMKIALLSGTLTYPKKGTFRQQLVDFNLKDNVPQMLMQWMKDVILYSIINQAAGNTATSIAAPRIYSSGIALTSDKLSLTGNSVAVAPSARYKGIGTLGAGGVTTDQAVVAGNELTLDDIMAAREVINSVDLGIPSWNCVNKVIMGYRIDAVCILSTTGLNQLKKDPVGQGKGITYAQTNYALMSGGKAGMQGLTGFVLENILFLEVPDDFLPRGVDSSTGAEVVNTRRCVLLGANAVDVAAGQGYELGKGGYVPGFSVDIDEDHKRLNKDGYADIAWNGGCKKTQIKGTGANAATAYDLGTYVITHYSGN